MRNASDGTRTFNPRLDRPRNAGNSALLDTIKHAWKLARYNYGVGYDWYIEYEGRVVGILRDQHFVEMFWDECSIEVIDPVARDDDHWNHCRFKFRSDVMNEYALYAFAGRSWAFISEGKVVMRGLYLDAPSDAEVRLSRFFQLIRRILRLPAPK